MMLLNIILYLSTIFNPITASDANESPPAKKVAAETNTNELTWNETRRLNWNDFAGQADDGDPLHALTATNLDVKANCKDGRFVFDVRSVFVTDESWSKNKKSEQLLKHEQLHFDLTEVFARKLRKRLSELDNACLAENQQNLGPIIGQVFDDWKTEQDRYDHECEHGLDYEQQDRWEKHIQAQLTELEAFKS